MPVYPLTRKYKPLPHICKLPRCRFLTFWRWRWVEGTSYICDICDRVWLLTSTANEFDSYSEWRQTSLDIENLGPLPFHDPPREDFEG